MNIEAIDEVKIDLQLQEEALELSKKRLKWQANRSNFVVITRELEKLGIEPRLDCQADYNINFTGDKKKLLAVLRLIMSAGFKTHNDKPQPGQSSWSAWFDKKDCSLRIWFSFSSSICKLVQVGTKTVSYEQPIYQTICGELLEELPSCETALISGTESTPALTNQEA